MSAFDAVYGVPPAELVEISVRARQFSPLVPGAEALEDCAPASLADIAVLAPPGTVERNYVFGRALMALCPGGRFLALAPNAKGGNRMARELQVLGCDVQTQSRHHHRICTLSRPPELQHLDTVIAAGSPQLLAEQNLWTQPGVFSWNRMDPGSALLAQTMPRLSGQGADLGCGIGVLAQRVLGSKQVTRITLIDIDRRAVEAARKNVRDARAGFIWGDALTADPGRSLDFVIMNPPFHDGDAEDRALGRAFVARAAELLRRGGTCWLVANRHLPYEDVLRENFTIAEQRLDQDGYKIFEATK